MFLYMSKVRTDAQRHRRHSQDVNGMICIQFDGRTLFVLCAAFATTTPPNTDDRRRGRASNAIYGQVPWVPKSRIWDRTIYHCAVLCCWDANENCLPAGNVKNDDSCSDGSSQNVEGEIHEEASKWRWRCCCCVDDGNDNCEIAMNNVTKDADVARVYRHVRSHNGL